MLVDVGVWLIIGFERDRVCEIVSARFDGMDERDLVVFGYGCFLVGFEVGVVVYYVGMVLLFKEVVEVCFVEGLVKVVFVMEMLVVGINMFV